MGFSFYLWYVQRAGRFAKAPAQEDKWQQLPAAYPTFTVSEGAFSFSRQELHNLESPPFGGSEAQLSPTHGLTSKV